MTRLEWVSSTHVPTNVFSPEESNQFQTNLILTFAVSHVVFQNIRSLRGKDGKVEEIMLGLQDQLVADTEEAIRPQDRRRKLIKHDPIFLPSRGGKQYKYKYKLDPVGSTVRYEMMTLCTGSV